LEDRRCTLLEYDADDQDYWVDALSRQIDPRAFPWASTYEAPLEQPGILSRVFEDAITAKQFATAHRALFEIATWHVKFAL